MVQPRKPIEPVLSQWQFTAAFEGVVPHLYLDTRNHVTCGVGFLIPDARALESYAWAPDVATARADYERVVRMLPGYMPSYYRAQMLARLSDREMREVFDVKVTHFRQAIAKAWSLDAQPLPVQLALVDMAYTLGAGGLRKYARLRQAINARNWRAAAGECSRRGVQPARDLATRRLFLGLIAGG